MILKDHRNVNTCKCLITNGPKRVVSFYKIGVLVKVEKFEIVTFAFYNNWIVRVSITAIHLMMMYGSRENVVFGANLCIESDLNG